ncbi:MAG: hypothetical protein H6Q52_1811, partial [Deltaproteobacteria bacterium]|nr:hypothetical protein [Deltaproteobacteria bacterium]
LYHIVINTDLVTYEEAAQLIGAEVIRRYKLDTPVRTATITGQRAAVF